MVCLRRLPFWRPSHMTSSLFLLIKQFRQNLLMGISKAIFVISSQNFPKLWNHNIGEKNFKKCSKFYFCLRQKNDKCFCVVSKHTKRKTNNLKKWKNNKNISCFQDRLQWHPRLDLHGHLEEDREEFLVGWIKWWRCGRKWGGHIFFDLLNS